LTPYISFATVALKAASKLTRFHIVMARLDPAIHVFLVE
jgi:hypothetical protein